jgi:upstream activation factor subunit UAF30
MTKGRRRRSRRLTSPEIPSMAIAKKKAAKKAAKKKTVKRPAAKKKAPAKKAAKRKPNAAFMKPMQPSAQLSLVVGSTPLPRTEVTKKLWQYIKRKGLQDAKERRMINADDALKPIFNGKAKVSMFDMTKLVNKHLKDTQ